MTITALGFKVTVSIPEQIMRVIWRDAHLKARFRHQLRSIKPLPQSYGSDPFDTSEWAVFLTESDAITWERLARQLISNLSDETVEDLAKMDQAIRVFVDNDQDFGPRRLAQQLEMIALGEAYFGAAIRAAKQLPIINGAEKAMLTRYENGATSGIDHVSLQMLALRIRNVAELAA
jgi:hypothetical protein